MKNQNYWIGGGIIVALLVLVFGWSMLTGGPAKSANEQINTGEQGSVSPSPAGTAEVRPSVSSEGEAVSVSDQAAGASVRVASVTTSRVSWVAVRDDMRIYGAAKVTPSSSSGAVENIEVPLLRGIEAGNAYKVVVYADDGDGVFDFKKDSLVSGVEASFNALSGE
jgi:hypothetical protein